MVTAWLSFHGTFHGIILTKQYRQVVVTVACPFAVRRTTSVS